MTTPDNQIVSPALLLDLYDEPIAFHRAHLRLTGSVAAALFLSYACHQAAELPEDQEGWLMLSADDWRKETGLSRFEQESARKALKKLGLIEERRIGMPARLAMRVKGQSLLMALRNQAEAEFPLLATSKT